MLQLTTLTQNKEIGLGVVDFALLGSTWSAVESDVGG